MLVDPVFKAALKSGASPVVLVEVDHPMGMVRFWSGIGALEWDGEVWTGAGRLGGVQVSRKSTELRIDEVRLWLTGLAVEDVDQIEGDIRNRIARVWLAALNSSHRVSGRPLLIDEILLDYVRDVVAEDGSARIEIIGQSGLWTLQRSTDKAWSDAEQRRRWPNDTGLGLIASLQNKDTKWTRT